MGKHRTTGDSIYWKLIRPVRLKEQRKIIIIFEHEKSKKSEIYLNEPFET